MIGKRVMAEELFYTFRLEDHVPADHPLRSVDRLLDTGFVRRVMAPHYSSIGRPSIDPELMIRMLLVGYLHGIRSERRLCAEVHLNLAYRWFCRLGLDGAVPDHSTFSKNRHGRFRDSGVMRALFEQVVALCTEAGLVPGEELAVDGSHVSANARTDRSVPGGAPPEAWAGDRTELSRPVREYLDALDAALPPAPDEPKQGTPKYLSPTDPQAAWSTKHGSGGFAYEVNLLADTAHGIIVDVETTPARLSQEVVAAKAMIERAKEQGRPAGLLAADGNYGTGPFLTWLVARSVAPYIPVLDRIERNTTVLSRNLFTYDAAEDSWTCPAGHALRFAAFIEHQGMRTYQGRPGTCGPCALRPSCTAGAYRQLSVSIHEPARQVARELAETEAFARSRRMRKKVEMLFAHLKEQLGLRRLRLRGLKGAAEEFHLAAAVQNLRKLAHLTAQPAPFEAEAAT